MIPADGETDGWRVYDWWSRHTRALDVLYGVAFLGRERAFRRRSLEALGLEDGERVLEMGCGIGNAFEALRAGVGDGDRVIGLDASDGIVAAARDRVREPGGRTSTSSAATPAARRWRTRSSTPSTPRCPSARCPPPSGLSPPRGGSCAPAPRRARRAAVPAVAGATPERGRRAGREAGHRLGPRGRPPRCYPPRVRNGLGDDVPRRVALRRCRVEILSSME